MADAVDLLARHSKVDLVAGGTDYYPARAGRAATHLLDLTRIAELQCLTRTPDGWRIGGAVTWADLARADLPPAFAGLQAAAREIGSVQIQNTGTLAGNLCNASPAADGVPPLLTLAAQVELTSAAGVRRLDLADFLLGVRRTARRPDELLTALLLPDPPEAALGRFQKLGARRYLVISIAMAAALVWWREGRIAGARLAVGACSPVAQRLAGLETALIGRRLGDLDPDLWQAHLAGLAPIDDVRASAGYRRTAVAELCRRAVLETAQDGTA